MSALFKKLNNIMRTMFIALTLYALQFVGFLIPGLAVWTKRLLFILTTYHELQRHRLFADITLARINQRLLKIKQTAVLDSVSEITQWKVLRLDMNRMRELGVDVDKIIRDGKPSSSDLERISTEIIKATPASLKYSRSAMYSDICRLLNSNGKDCVKRA